MVKFDGHTLTYEEGVEHGERTAQGLTYWENLAMFAMWSLTKEVSQFSLGMAEGLNRHLLKRDDA